MRAMVSFATSPFVSFSVVQPLLGKTGSGSFSGAGATAVLFAGLPKQPVQKMQMSVR
jgi:hypothetical protein